MECMLLLAGGTEFVHWWEVVCSSECPLSEVPLYIHLFNYIFISGAAYVVSNSTRAYAKPMKICKTNVNLYVNCKFAMFILVH